jgi:methylmalonyl-CoA mutase N-terminal domain/subunit
VAFDLPTQLGMDSDDPLSYGEVGRVGVAIDSIVDMRELFDGIQLDQVSTSMTINSPAIIPLAMYIAVGDCRTVDGHRCRNLIKLNPIKQFSHINN